MKYGILFTMALFVCNLHAMDGEIPGIPLHAMDGEIPGIPLHAMDGEIPGIPPCFPSEKLEIIGQKTTRDLKGDVEKDGILLSNGYELTAVKYSGDPSDDYFGTRKGPDRFVTLIFKDSKLRHKRTTTYQTEEFRLIREKARSLNSDIELFRREMLKLLEFPPANTPRDE